MTKRYHIVMVRETLRSPWGIHFGDYDQQVALQEGEDIIESGDYKARNVCVRTVPSDTQEAVDAWVAEFNRGVEAARNRRERS